MGNTLGLKFKKLDLHVHTPASQDYKNSPEQTDTPEQIVDAALAQGLAAIAITDHHTGSAIDSIKEIAHKKGLTVFPGVEIKAYGGEKGIHLVALFDVDKDTAHIHQFLDRLRIHDHSGKNDLTISATPMDVTQELQAFDKSAILVLAHCASNSGALADLKGEQRNQIFGKSSTALLGAEASESDFLNETKKKRHTRVIDLFDGGFADYHKKKLGVYQASDSHCLADIGKSPTYFKVDDQLTLEDIRQCLIDRETRIRQIFEYSPNIYPRIETVKITGGFLSGQEFPLHEGLNSLLGAKGAGKSLIVELIRFALDQESENPDIERDHKSKLNKCLGNGAKVVLTIMDESGKKYQIQRTYNSGSSNPVSIIDVIDGSVQQFDIRRVFPVLFLSQNEIVKIAEDTSGTSQREFIDRFFDFHMYQADIHQKQDALRKIDGEVSECLGSFVEKEKLLKSIATCQEEIRKTNKQLENDLFPEFTRQESIGRAVSGQKHFVSSLKSRLQELSHQFVGLTPPVESDAKINEDLSVSSARELSQAALSTLAENLDRTIEQLSVQESAVQEKVEEWKASFQVTKAAYEKLVQDTGGTQQLLLEKRKAFQEELQKLEQKLSEHTLKAQMFSEKLEERKNHVLRMKASYDAFFHERRLRCEFFTENSRGSLNVEIAQSADHSDFVETLNELKKGSHIRSEVIEDIATKVTAEDLIDLIIAYEASGRAEPTSILEFARQRQIKDDTFFGLVMFLLESYEYQRIFGMLYTSVSQDIPKISYNVMGAFKPLDEISVGQKAMGLLIIALSDGSFPIIIDQPEDSLDLKSIWDDVCSQLRSSKEARQFIFTTHNSSVAVASDSDKYVLLKSDATHGWVECSGSINNPTVREAVMDYLEGGEVTYAQKRQKYNL